MASPTGTHRVLVSYTATPQIFLTSGRWKQIQAALTSQLPLRNIHWKPASRTSVRTIQELAVTLKPLEGIRDDHTSQIPVTLLDKPLLNILIVTCEDGELDSYRNTIKKQIKDWHTTVTSRKNQECTIWELFHLKGSVLEKMKTDFNTDRRERCVQLILPPGNENPAIWAEPMSKIKDGILCAFDSAVAQREEEVKRSESQRQMPGWNFCTFFILKESLSYSFEGMNLFEEALLQYDELEASFHHVLKEKNLSWFGTLISPAPKDDSSPLLDISKKPYRDLILANTISVFDFRIYVLARQCELLAKLCRINEVTGKVGAFLSGFGRRLREVEANVPRFFVESWIYSSALSVVEQCDAWSSAHPLEGTKLAAFSAGKGELLELARTQVGHLPTKPPFSCATQAPRSPEITPTNLISNTEVLNSIEDSNRFYDLYIHITNRAIEMYAKAGRRKFALKLHGSLAALDLHRQRLSIALTTYTSLPAHYAPHMWTSLESFMLSRALDTHSSMQKPKDIEWIHILLSFLKAFTENGDMELLIHEDDRVEYVSKMVDSLKDSAAELDADLPHPDHPMLSVRVSSIARLANTKDGSFLDVTVQNLLPCALPADQITIIAGGRDGERLEFKSLLETIPPGKTRLALFCPTPTHGIYVLESSEIRISRLLFQWTHWKPPSSSEPHRTGGDSPSLIRIPRDIHALEVRIRQPDRIKLGERPSVLVTILTGRNHAAKVAIKLTAPGVTFFPLESTIYQDDLPTLETSSDSTTLSDIPERSSIAFLQPHTDASAAMTLKIQVEVEYTTMAEPEVTRKLYLRRTTLTALPISVNVEDFFRGTRLFSKYTISTTSHQHVRILSASLSVPPDKGLDDLKIVSCPTQPRVASQTITPSQSVNFLFYTESPGGPVKESLDFTIHYRMLRDESRVDQVLGDSSTVAHHRSMLVDQLVEALTRDASWVEMYRITGELVVPDHECDNHELDQLLSQVKDILRNHRHGNPAEGHWREIIIPVDVPHMNIVAAARIRILSTPFSSADHSQDDDALPLYAGQPISASLTIQTSFHWGSAPEERSRRYTMRFDVEEIARDWLVSGRKRGDFVATHDGIYTVPMTLIALHHGELALPKVTVNALPTPGEVTMRSMAIPSTETYQLHGAEKVLVLPRGGRSTFVVGMGTG
ncbi:trafficking protein particle complex subunit 10 [Infundibulicybe gibba]|nr:trafficking protein particle complex subunit 10 [Infundibulicybe gibba]